MYAQDGLFTQDSTQQAGRGVLRQTWINERGNDLKSIHLFIFLVNFHSFVAGAPELLPYEAELVEEVRNHIKEQVGSWSQLSFY